MSASTKDKPSRRPSAAVELKEFFARQQQRSAFEVIDTPESPRMHGLTYTIAVARHADLKEGAVYAAQHRAESVKNVFIRHIAAQPNQKLLGHFLSHPWEPREVTADPKSLEAAVGVLVESFRRALSSTDLAPRMEVLESRINAHHGAIDRFEARIARLEELFGASVLEETGVSERADAARQVADRVTAFLKDIFGDAARGIAKAHSDESGNEEWVVEAHYGLDESALPEDLAEKHERVLREYLELPKELRRGIVFARLVD